jgi:hypothetical protein
MKVAKAPLRFPFKEVFQRRVLSCVALPNATALGVLQAPIFAVIVAGGKNGAFRFRECWVRANRLWLPGKSAHQRC